MFQIGWFSSGRGAGSRSLLSTMQDNIEKGNINAKIAFVFCNREPGQSDETDKFHELVRYYKLPVICFSSRLYKPELRHYDIKHWRIEYDRELISRIKEYPCDLSVLAGYMLVVGSEMCYKYKMINLHPATPWGPTGTWKEVIWELIEQDVSETGVMMHLVTPDLDKGPPVTYCTFSIRGQHFDNYWSEIKGVPIAKVKAQQGENNNLFQTIRKHGLVREHPLIVATVKAFSEKNVRIENNKILGKDDKPISSYDLTSTIDSLINEQELPKSG